MKAIIKRQKRTSSGTVRGRVFLNFYEIQAFDSDWKEVEHYTATDNFANSQSPATTPKNSIGFRRLVSAFNQTFAQITNEFLVEIADEKQN